MFKIISIVLLFTSTIFALDDYQSTKYKGKNKYQRIEVIETYMEKLSKNYNSELQGQLKNFNEKIKALEDKTSNDLDTSKQLSALRLELNTKFKKLTDDHAKDITELKDDMNKVKAEALKATEDLGKSLLKQIQAVQKIMDGYEKRRNGPPIR